MNKMFLLPTIVNQMPGFTCSQSKQNVLVQREPVITSDLLTSLVLDYFTINQSHFKSPPVLSAAEVLPITLVLNLNS